MRLPAGTTLGPYEVGPLLGVGGMGEVYRAIDLRLDRAVAIKILPADLSSSPERRQRFYREARTISGFSHPHICRVYDVGDHEGVEYIVMEFLDGETLEARLRRGALPIADALACVVQIGDALDQAHRHGIVHRDLKPGNVMLTAAGAVLLDFGLATPWLPQPGGTVPSASIASGSITTEGTIAGTPAYMAPEQYGGEDADASIDIFAFGSLLFEVLTGRRAFGGDTHAQIMAAVMTSTPPAVSTVRLDAPAALDRVVARCLARNPEDRWQTARDLVSELSWIAETSARLPRARRWSAGRLRVPVAVVLAATVVTGAGVTWRTLNQAIDSIAVLPLRNASGDPKMDYLSDGLTESVIRALSPLPSLRVMSGASVARYKGQPADPKTVAQLLHVRAVLVGTVSRRDDTLSVNIELVNGDDNRQIFAEHYTRPVAGIFDLQEDIARQIADSLRLHLSVPESRRVVKRYTASTEAYELYLRGRYYWNRRTPADLMRSLGFFQDAIGRDPGYALAYAGLADAYDMLGSAGYDVLPPLDVLPKAKAAATEALRLDDQLAEAHAAMGFVLRFDWDRAGASREHLRSVELDPNYATGRQWLASQFWTEGRFDLALAQLTQAQALDPLSPLISLNVGRHFYYARDYGRAIDAYQKALALDPHNFLAGQLLALTYVAGGRHDEAVAQLGRTASPPGAFLAVRGYIAGVTGDIAGARQAIVDLDALGSHRYIPAYAFATVYAGLGDKERAFQYLDRAREEHSAYLDYINIEPTLDGLRDDPRFAELLRRVNLPIVNVNRGRSDAHPPS
ncbi:MAG TPA: protein kinase [Vicinamibacterales bacterium]|nr:protein kinase [Vicinamibacterales bacterium]